MSRKFIHFPHDADTCKKTFKITNTCFEPTSSSLVGTPRLFASDSSSFTAPVAASGAGSRPPAPSPSPARRSYLEERTRTAQQPTPVDGYAAKAIQESL